MSDMFSVKIPNDGIPIVTWHNGKVAPTPDEWAKKIIGNPQLFGSGVSLAMTYAAIAAAIRAAVAAEREACAALADECTLPAHDVGKLDGHGDEAEAIAAAIRARGEPTA